MEFTNRQTELYREAAAQYSHALERLARAYEFDPEKQKDLLQEIHLAVWQSLGDYEGRCSLRTWVYRVAHNTATSYALREQRRNAPGWVTLKDIETAAASDKPDRTAERRLALDRLMELIRVLKPFDRQIMVLYLEGLDADSIGEIVGISSGHVRVQVHRLKAVLARRFHGGSGHEQES